MATATAKRTKADEPAEPMTFEAIAHRKMGERIAAYRSIIERRAAGDPLTATDLEQAGELLERLGLPQYAFDRDVEAMRRHAMVQSKVQSAADAAPDHKARAAELGKRIEKAKKELAAMIEEQRQAVSKSNKPGAYAHTLTQLVHDHPHLLADIDTASRLRCEEMDRRKRATVGGDA